jgi:predicted N-acetyltransferase YhbS
MTSIGEPQVTIRRATPADAAVCGKICYDAFYKISTSHGFPCDFPAPEIAVRTIESLFAHPGFYCVVAESGGRLLGSNCLDERSLIAGIGPITVDPTTQNHGVGRMLMDAVMERARERHPAGVRLVQAAFHNRSLSLYTNLGFDIREPLTCMQGRTREREVAGCTVRPARLSDVDACNALSHRVHGFERGREFSDAIAHGTARVVERDGRVTGYVTDLALWGHATCETNRDLQALIVSVESFGGSGILVPSRNSVLLRWCLANGLRVVQPMTLMTVGLYNEPACAWLPSVMF